VIYKDGKVYNYQTIDENLNLDDLKFFVKNSIKIGTITIRDFRSIELKTNQINKIHKFIKPIKSYTFRYFLLYIILLFFALYYFSFYNEEDFKELDFNLERNSIEVIKKDTEFVFISSFILELFEEAKDKNINIISFSLKNAKIILSFESESKDSAYKFLDVFDNFSIEKMSFDIQIKRYKTDAVFKILRK
jgi:NAD kinase